MKKVLLFLLITSAVILTSCGAAKHTVITGSEETAVDAAKGTDFSRQTTWVLGYFELRRISSPPHSEWFIKGSDEYNPDVKAVDSIKAIMKDDLTIKIVLGTWCPDSRREVPRFMKILSLLNFPLEKVTFIGVDDAKLSPVGEYESLGIVRVPTFIFYVNNIEKGRIIENPVTSLEQDMSDILSRNE